MKVAWAKPRAFIHLCIDSQALALKAFDDNFVLQTNQYNLVDV
jgi:hypothetical protein